MDSTFVILSQAKDPHDSVSTPLASRTCAHDIVSSPFARQTTRFAPDSSSFDSRSSLMMRNIAELVTIIGPRISLTIVLLLRIVARLFDTIAMVPFISAPLSVLIALLLLAIRVMSVTTALMTGITEVMSIILRIMWLTRGMAWLTKELLSALTAMMTGSDPGAESPLHGSLPVVRDAHGQLRVGRILPGPGGVWLGDAPPRHGEPAPAARGDDEIKPDARRAASGAGNATRSADDDCLEGSCHTGSAAERRRQRGSRKTHGKVGRRASVPRRRPPWRRCRGNLDASKIGALFRG